MFGGIKPPRRGQQRLEGEEQSGRCSVPREGGACWGEGECYSKDVVPAQHQ